jgi:hypothetical protein
MASSPALTDRDRIAELVRLDEDTRRERYCKRWGPYLSERQWGTVREDYSADGAACRSFPHEQAHCRAYRWGEDGLAGVSDHRGDAFRVQCPTGSDRSLTPGEVATELSQRLIRLFLRDDRGGRPLFGTAERSQRDPRWNASLLFHEYFDGDTGRGLGASHQTGWTALVAKLIHQSGV